MAYDLKSGKAYGDPYGNDRDSCEAVITIGAPKARPIILTWLLLLLTDVGCHRVCIWGNLSINNPQPSQLCLLLPDCYVYNLNWYAISVYHP